MLFGPRTCTLCRLYSRNTVVWGDLDSEFFSMTWIMEDQEEWMTIFSEYSKSGQLEDTVFLKKH